MISRESAIYSLRNLNHRKGRSFLTVFSILIGIATIFIFISFGYGLYDYVDSFTTGSSADKVLIMAKGAGIPGMDSSFIIDNDDLDVIDKTSGVYEATGAYFSPIEVRKSSESKTTFLVSYDPKIPLLFDVLQTDIEEGRMLNQRDRGVLLGYNYMVDGKIFEKGLEVNDLIEVNGKKIKVIGFLESIGSPPDDAQVYVTNEMFLDTFPETKGYAEIVARVDVSNIDQVIENIEKNLRKHRGLEEGDEDFFVQSFEDMIESYSGALDVVVAFVILIALVSVLVSGVNTANTMITSVLERYKEIGILKSIGARNSEIFGIFLFESGFLGLVAGGLGVLLGFGLTQVASNILSSLGWGFLQPSYSPWIFIGCVLFAFVTGAVSGVLPALKASRINAVDALRYE